MIEGQVTHHISPSEEPQPRYRDHTPGQRFCPRTTALEGRIESTEGAVRTTADLDSHTPPDPGRPQYIQLTNRGGVGSVAGRV